MMTDTEILDWLDENIEFHEEGKVCEHSPKKHCIKIIDPKNGRGKYSVREAVRDVIGHTKNDTEILDWLHKISAGPMVTVLL